MKLSVKGLAMASGLLWGGCLLICGVCNLIWPAYGAAFLEAISSIYPGYNAGLGVGSVAVGTLLALVDGAVGGALLAWLYNFFAAKFA